MLSSIANVLASLSYLSWPEFSWELEIDRWIRAIMSDQAEMCTSVQENNEGEMYIPSGLGSRNRRC